MQANTKDVAAGALFMAIGLYFAIDSLINLRMGQAFSMGPGYFPLVLGGILVAFGVVIAIRAIGKPVEAIGNVAWRGIALVIGAILFFALTVRGLGVGLSLFGCTFMAARSSGLLGWSKSVVLSAVITAFSVVVFIKLLGLPYPVIGHWLRF